ncbi:MAG: protoporphyrinogen oxidase [Planctomycetes bacterium]|nr:protoporphyrinogen oxidase [Planctomycetota bacterium]
MSDPVLVVGAGLSGLALAHGLRSRGVDVTLLDERAEPGGNLRTKFVNATEGRWLLELGPNSFGDAQAPIMGLVESTGLTDRLVRTEGEAERRWVWRAGALREVPLKPQQFLLSPLLPLAARLRLVREMWIPPRPEDAPEETLAEFADRRLGRVAREKLLTPVIGGIYAGDPTKLGAESTFPAMVALERQHGSLLRAMKSGSGPPSRGRLASFTDGLRELPDAILRGLRATPGCDARLAAPVERIERAGSGWLAVLASGERIVAGRVFLTSPAWRTADLVEGALPDVARELRQIHYAAVAVVHVGVPRAGLGNAPAGFGFLVPRDEGLRILGCIFSSHLFPGRAPAGHELFTVFVGGDLDPAGAALPDDELRSTVLGDLRRAFGACPEPALFEVTRWPRAIPQYWVGHKDRLARIDAALEPHRGLHAIGNWRGGIAMDACVREASALAERVAR